LANDDFNRLSESELDRLTSDELIEHIRDASDEGRADAAQAAIAVLCYRHFDDIKRRIGLRVPPEEVEDQAMTVILAAIKSAFDGTSIGEFRVWLNRIIDRRGIADLHRAREDKPTPGPLPTEHQGDEGIWGEEPADEDESGRVIVESLIEESMDGLSHAHRDVIELNVFDDVDASGTAERINEKHPDLDTPMTAANVHKIVSRFRERLTGLLEDDE